MGTDEPSQSRQNRGAVAVEELTRRQVEVLTRRQVEVLRLLAKGLTDAQIADQLFLSRRTVHAHLREIFRRLEVPNRSAATRYAIEHGITQ